MLRVTGGSGGGASRQLPVGSQKWWCRVSCVGGDKGAGIAYHKHNDDNVIVVIVPRPSVLHGHHVADCDMAQLAHGVIRGPGLWRVPVVVFGACWSSFVGRCVWLSFVVGHSQLFVVLLVSCQVVVG